MKEKFQPVEVEVISFNLEDVISSSDFEGEEDGVGSDLN